MVPQLTQGKALNPDLAFEVLHSPIPMTRSSLTPLYALGPSLSHAVAQAGSSFSSPWDWGLKASVSSPLPCLQHPRPTGFFLGAGSKFNCSLTSS